MPVDALRPGVVFFPAAVGVLLLLREPLRHADQPGSRGFLVSVVTISLWLAAEGATTFVPGVEGTLALYNLTLFGVFGCFLGYLIMGVEHTTQRLASRHILGLLAGVALAHLLVLWTNFFWLHEFVYRQTSTVENGILVPDRGPGFWVHTLASYGLIVFSGALFAREVAESSGLRRRQAALLLAAPLPGLVTNGFWLFAGDWLPRDPTPLGVVTGVVLLGWALYRADVLEIVPVARKTVVEEMTDGVVALDTRGRVLDWNRVARERFGVDKPVVGMDATDFFAAIPDQAVENLVESDDGEQELSFDLTERTCHFAVLVSPTDVDATGSHGRILVFREVTELRQRERQLVEQNETLETFATIVSNDIQEPLDEIRTAATQAIGREDPTQADRVLDTVDQMNRQIDSLLELANVGQRIEDPEPVDLAAITETAWRRVWSADAQLSVETDRRVYGDPARIQQLFEICFRNAIEHAGGDVRITVGERSNGFYVEDDGPGIPARHQLRVFERGYTISGDGTGLGLAIAAQIASAHGWTIQATEGTAGGTRIALTRVTVVE